MQAASFTEIAGTTLLAINTGMLLHLVYSAGRRVQQIEDHERRITVLEEHQRAD
jgi:hypothetical protein